MLVSQSEAAMEAAPMFVAQAAAAMETARV
jgi:hypothetical protein